MSEKSSAWGNTSGKTKRPPEERRAQFLANVSRGVRFLELQKHSDGFLITVYAWNPNKGKKERVKSLPIPKVYSHGGELTLFEELAFITNPNSLQVVNALYKHRVINDDLLNKQRAVIFHGKLYEIK